MKIKALVLGNAPLPFENQKRLYGFNIRTWNTVKPLWKDGHEVILIGLRTKGAYQNEETLPKIIKSRQMGFTYYALDESLFRNNRFLQRIYDEFQPDCIIGVNTLPASKAVALKTNKPIWADLNGFIMAEAQAKAHVYDDNTYLNDFWQYEKIVLKRADIFSVVSLPQKFALIGELAVSGRLNKYTFGYEFVYHIPNSIDDIEYQHKRKAIREICVDNYDFVILWSGSYNTWTDINTLFMAVETAMDKNPKIKFVSIGGPVIGHDEKTYYKFLDKVRLSKFSNRFIFNEWVPTEDIPNYYFESNVGINIDKFNYETLLGARTRIVDMLKAGLPVLTSLGTEISYLIEKEKLGFVYPLGDAEELARTILFLVENRELLREYGQRGKEYVFKNLTSDEVTTSLREWVKNPRPAPDRGKSITLSQHSPRNKFGRYLDYTAIEGFTVANKRAFNFLVRKIKKYKKIL